MPAVTYRPELDARDLRGHAGDRRAQHGVIEIALRLIDGSSRLRIRRIFLDWEVLVAEELVANALLLHLELLERGFRHDQQGHRVVEIGLRARAVGNKRVLAIEVALLQLQGFTRECNALL